MRGCLMIRRQSCPPTTSWVYEARCSRGHGRSTAVTICDVIDRSFISMCSSYRQIRLRYRVLSLDQLVSYLILRL